ncbi:hypothetical protein GBA52_016814 [Prunus armeniaca]|nr:hypothetical protein GBA52_016814 [Prunus armeniaca]
MNEREGFCTFGLHYKLEREYRLREKAVRWSRKGLGRATADEGNSTIAQMEWARRRTCMVAF